MARSQVVLDELGGQIIAADWIAAINTEIGLWHGTYRRGSEHGAERAVAIAPKDGVVYLRKGGPVRVRGQALAALAPPRWDEAEDQFKESLRLFKSGQHRVEAAYTHLALGSVCRDRGKSRRSARELGASRSANLKSVTCPRNWGEFTPHPCGFRIKNSRLN